MEHGVQMIIKNLTLSYFGYIYQYPYLVQDYCWQRYQLGQHPLSVAPRTVIGIVYNQGAVVVVHNTLDYQSRNHKIDPHFTVFRMRF